MSKSHEAQMFKDFKYQYETNTMSLEWWQKNVIYHIYLPSFKDNNCDGIGDFSGLISKLNYLEDLNIKTLLISPFYPSPKKDYGYDVSSYTDIDPIYGAMDDFDNLMTKLNEKGMNIIVDLILNHTSDQHKWFQKSIKKEDPYTDYYIWVDKNPESTEDEPLPPNNWISVFGGSAWTWNNSRKQFYYHQFLPEQPDLNFRNFAVKEEFKKILAFWLEKGVDGFRIDAASHLFEDESLMDEPVLENSEANEDEYGYLDHIYTKGLKENYNLLKELRIFLDNYESKTRKAKIMVAEVNEDIEDLMKYYGDVGDKIADFPFNFQLYRVKSTFTGTELYEIISAWFINMPKGKYPNWVMSSHDDPRVVSRVGKRLALSLHMTTMLLPGIPICYYGDELGMENTQMKPEDIKDSFALRTSAENSRDPMRTPMQWNAEKNAGFSDSDEVWLPVNENYETVNVEVEKEDPLSFLNIFKYLVKLCEEPSVLFGTLEFPLVNTEIFSFLRFLVDAKCFLLVLNMSSSPACVKISNTSHLLPNEGLIEVSSGHITMEQSSDNISVNKKSFKCKCKNKNLFPSNELPGSSKTKNVKISLNNIHLKPKEAVIISFIGQEEM